MTIPILRSKFRAPADSTALRRDRLFARLDDALAHALTLVSADAGYGKSTLVATYLAERGRAAVWLRLDELDRHLDILFAHLCAGLAECLPAYHSPLAALAARLGQRHRSPIELAGDLAAALASSPATAASGAPAILVLEDFEAVQGNRDVCSAISQMALLLSPTVRFLVLSRARPTGLPLTRFSLEERLAEITRTDLAFTAEETEQLFAEVYGLTLSYGEMQLLHSSCEGWPAGLRLVAEALRGTTAAGRAGFWFDLANSPDMVQYLWSEALAGQPESTQDFLLRTSVLASLKPAITDPLLGITHSRQLLTRLAHSHLFTIAEGGSDPSFRYHGLFRSFLHHQLEERYGPDALRDMHQRAAGLYEGRGNYNHAIGHYLAARNYPLAARVMSRVVDTYPPRTFLRLFNGWLEQVAPGVRMAYPSVFSRRVLSLETLQRLTPALEEMLAEARRRDDLLMQAHTHHCLASLPYYRCDSPAALRHYGESAEIFRTLHDAAMEADSLSQMAYTHWLAGDAAQAHALAEQAFELCHGHRDSMPRMHCLWVMGAIALATGDLDRAEKMAQTAMQVAGEEIDQGVRTFPLSILAEVASARGDHELAIRLGTQALEYGLACEVRVDQGWGALCAGTAYLRAGHLTAAQPLLAQAAELLAGYAQPELSVSARLAGLCLALAEPEAAQRWLSRALEISRTRRLDHLLLLEFAHSSALPVFALENRIHPDYLLTLIDRLPEPALEPIQRLLEEPGHPYRRGLARALAAAGPAEAQPPVAARSTPTGAPQRLELQAFGRLAVRLGETDLTPELNRRNSCCRLLLFLLARRRRAVPREQIIANLWPEVSTESGANRFHVALSWLRRILEPGLSSGNDSRIVVREADRYRLATENCRVDADEFVRLASPLVRGHERRSLSAGQEQALIQATAIHGGDFLEDYPYEEFLDGERACLREMQRLALIRLGDHYRAHRQASRALQCFRSALALDPCREDVHRRLIFAHLLAGDCAAAVRAWHECGRVLQDELGVGRGPATRALAFRLLGIPAD